MKLTVPKYYAGFKCIDRECEDTCCAGWEVDLDQEAWDYYSRVGGEFGKRLKSVMNSEGGLHFTLKENKDCPFLNGEGLCDLYTELGEDRLCVTCAMFPRFVEEYGNVREMGIAFSCKTAARLILTYEGDFATVTSEDGKPLTSYNDINPEFFMGLRAARERAYKLAQDRDFTVWERAALLLSMCEALQHSINGHRFSRLPVVSAQYGDREFLVKRLKSLRRSCRNTDAFGAMDGVLSVFHSFELVKQELLCLMDEDERLYGRNGANRDETAHNRDMQEFLAYYVDGEIHYEHILVYYIYRYFLKAVYDDRLLGRMKMGLVGLAVVRELDLCHWRMNGGTLRLWDQVDITHLYSREVEHSDVNFARLEKLCEEDGRFAADMLAGILLS
jgi:lysine-N-methylase